MTRRRDPEAWDTRDPDYARGYAMGSGGGQPPRQGCRWTLLMLPWLLLTAHPVDPSRRGGRAPHVPRVVSRADYYTGLAAGKQAAGPPAGGGGCRRRLGLLALLLPLWPLLLGLAWFGGRPSTETTGRAPGSRCHLGRRHTDPKHTDGDWWPTRDSDQVSDAERELIRQRRHQPPRTNDDPEEAR